MRRLKVAPSWLAAACVFAGWPISCSSTAHAEFLPADFASPPAFARPWVYWFWMDGNLSREGITADLEAMSRVGIGGVILMEVDVGIPRGPVKFMSEPWRALFQHAVTEAERLGLEITLNAGPGWTGSGGPWVRPDQSMQHIVASATQVTGPSDVAMALPRPAPREPHFVHAPMPPAVAKAREEFYQDVAVLAFPTPAEGPKIADSDEKSLYYRLPYSSHPGVKPFLPAPAEFPALPAGAAIPRDRVVDLSGRLGPDGRLAWSVPDGKWTVLRFGRTSTGANTRPAPEPGIGLECDKFDKAALDAHFDAFIGTLLRELGPRPLSRRAGWTMLHIDSWEMGSQNWTAAFRDEFRQRRGYDPLPYLPAVTGRVVDSIEFSERFLWDLRQTANELIIENHAEHLKSLGRRHGFGLSIEPYDLTPCADLDLGGVADVPMCEFWAEGYGFDTSFSCIEAVSVAHTRGRPIVAAESFTATDGEAWRLYPGNMKPQADWAFCFGINRLVFHRYAHQPWLDRWPGMTMGPYGVHYERTQTWWSMAGAWHDYLSRCQLMLRRGLPVADICYLAAEGAPHVFRPPPSALRGSQPVPDRRGYNFDGCAPRTLEQMTVQDGRLVLPDGMSYRVLVLPDVETMTPALLGRLRKLVEAGAVVVGPCPRKSPSLSDYPNCDAQVQRLATDLWASPTASGPSEGRAVGKGKVVESNRRAMLSDATRDPVPLLRPAWGSVGEQGTVVTYPPLYGDYEQVAGLLARMNVPPDFESDGPVRYTHRRDGETDLYFVANGGNASVQTRCQFRVTGRVPQIWDPVSGDIRSQAAYEEKDGRTRLTLSLEARGSVFVVFQRAPSVAAKKGKSPSAGQVIAEVSGPWEVRFQPGRGAPKSLTFDTLLDWSKHPDNGVRYFSGEATYTARLRIPDERLGSGRRIRLDLGRVEVMARVSLNGRNLGVLWTPPFRVDVTDAARGGDNTLEITVANLWPNRLIGDQLLPEGDRVAWTTWNPFRGDSPLLESGLLGPVILAAGD